MEERVAQNVAAMAFAGCLLTLVSSSNLAGYETVSKMSRDIILLTLSMASSDSLNSASTIPGTGTISRSP